MFQRDRSQMTKMHSDFKLSVVLHHILLTTQLLLVNSLLGTSAAPYLLPYSILWLDLKQLFLETDLQYYESMNTYFLCESLQKKLAWQLLPGCIEDESHEV